MKLFELDEKIAEVCPIHGLNSRGVISFKDDATAKQQRDAQDIVDIYGPDVEEFKDQIEIDKIITVDTENHIDVVLDAEYTPEINNKVVEENPE